MTRYYSDPSRAEDKFHIADIEVFYAEKGTLGNSSEFEDKEYGAGWYWWTCMPGCMPDSDPNGPFDTEEEAVEDMREQYDG